MPAAPDETCPLRVLQYSYGGGHLSGIDTYLLETYRSVDRKRVQFDFLYRYQSPLGAEATEIQALGGRVFALNVAEHEHVMKRQLQELRRLFSFLRRHRYEVVEINMTALFMCLQAAVLARLFGAKVRIVHAHDAVKNESRSKRLLKRAFTPALELIATDFWACSDDAAAYLYSRRRIMADDWVPVRNGIESEKFRFDVEARSAMRAELGIADDALCVCVVGRVTPQKNHAFAIAVFAEVVRRNPAARLILVGDGPLLPEIRRLTVDHGVQNEVLFLGSRSDVPRLLCAADVLFAPSLHEGFPLIALEAQASGLPLVVSTAFPAASAVTESVTFIDLGESAPVWAGALLESRAGDRSFGVQSVREAGYDRVDTATRVQALYLEIARRL